MRFEVYASSETPRILYVSVRRVRERSWLEARALGMGDCNFTHGVTHHSPLPFTSRLAFLQQEPVVFFHPSSSLRQPASCVLLSFVDCTSATTCHGIPTSAPRCRFPCPSLSPICSPLRYCHETPFAMLHVSWQAEPLLYCQPLSDGPELIRICRWKRFNVETINYLR